MAKRKQSDQAIVEYLLKSIKGKSTEELLMFWEKMEISLDEMIGAGLSISQLEELPLDFIQNQVDDGFVDKEELEKVGLSQEKITQLFGYTVPQPAQPASEPIGVEKDITSSGTRDSQPSALLDRIKYGDVFLNEVRDGLLEATIFESDLINLGYSHSLINRIREYTPQPAYFPKVSELPDLRSNATDVYFLGMPGSGKSTMLASLLSYCNKEAILKGTTDNSHGTKYRNQLVTGMALGFLPDSTATNFINFIPVDFRNKERGVDHKLNFIDMAGEKFKEVAEGGIEKFNAIKGYLKNDNRKCLIFVLDYFEDNDRLKILKQDQNLQEVLNYLEDFEILQQTDIIYLVVTKADLFPSDSKQEYADAYIDRNYTNFLTSCQEAKDKYGQIEIKSFPYSIGKTVFHYLLEESDPELNENLKYYPGLLADQIIEDSAFAKKGGFKLPWI